MSEWQRIVGALWRMPRALLAALLATWTGVMLALWLAPIGAILFLIILLVQPHNSATSALLFTVHTGGVTNFFTIVAALVTGAIAGFVGVYAAIIASQPTQLAGAILSGAVVAVVISWVATRLELRLLLLRGYRTPSRREFENSITPAVVEISQAMDLDLDSDSDNTLPTILISDSPVPQAWTHTNTIVVTKGLLEGFDPPEFRAVLAHEFCHWRAGDGVALRLVWALSWPLALLYNVGSALTGSRQGKGGQGVTVALRPTFFTALIWLALWPVAVLIRFVIVPLAAYEGRRMEYEADAGVAALGMGDALMRAFERLPPFEAGRTAWEDALARTHPPLEHRIDFLLRLADTEEEEAEGGEGGEGVQAVPAGPSTRTTTRRLRLVGAVGVVLLLIALSPLVTESGTGGKGRTERQATAGGTTPVSAAPSPSPSEAATTNTTSTGSGNEAEASPGAEEASEPHLSSAESAFADTSASAVGAAARFAYTLYSDAFNEEQLDAAIYAAAAPGDTAAVLSQATARFAAQAKAVSHDTVTNSATVLAHRLVSATPATNPTTATVELWVSVHFTVNGSSPRIYWVTAPYTLTWDASSWKPSAILPTTNGPTPAELHGATAPHGFTPYAAPPKG